MTTPLIIAAELPETQLDVLANKVADVVLARLEQKNLLNAPEDDEIGGVVFAAQLTGYEVPTIYDLVHKRKIPHSKPEGKLNFSKKELLAWMKSKKRKTVSEIEGEAAAS